MNAADRQLAIRISADIKQAQAALTELQAEIKAVAKETTEVATASKASAAAATEEAAAIKEVAVAQAARAETEVEAAARIKQMVQASLAAVETNKTLELSERALRERAGERIEMTGEELAAYRAKAAAAATDRASAAAQIADYTALDAVLQKKTLTTDELAAAEAALDRLQAEGALSTTELAAAFAALDKAKIATTEATEANTAANIENAASINLTSGAVAREYGILGGELARGNYTRFEGSLITLANRTGILQKAMSGTGLAITATVAAIAALGVEALRGYESDQKLNDALLATGNYAGVGAGEIRGMASSISDSVVSSSEAARALAKLAQSGLFTGDQLKTAGQAAVDFGRLTGQSADDAAGDIERLASGSVAELIKLNNQYHFLSATQFEWIKQLEEEGKTYDATSAKLDAFAGKMHERAVQAENDLNYFGRIIEALKNEPAALGSLLQSLSQRTTDAERLGKVQDELAGYRARGLIQYDSRAGHAGNYQLGNNFGGLSPEMQTRVLDAVAAYNKLRDAVNGETKAAQKNADAQKEQDAGIAGIDFLAKEVDRYQSATKKYNAEVKQINDATTAAIKADPAHRDKYVADQATALAGAKEAYDRAVNKGAGGVNHAQLAADVAAVQNSLKQISDAYGNADKVLEAQHKAGLISDQAYYDGLRADLNRYETDEVAALEREKVAATSHIVTQQDRIRADQKVAQIDQQITQVHADAAAKREQIDAQERQSIQRSDEAWQAFLRTLETPAEANLDDALQKVGTLNAALQQGRTDAAQYQDILTRITEQSISSVPSAVARFQRHSGPQFTQATAAENYDYQGDVAQLTAQFAQEMAISQGGYAQMQAAAEAFYAAMEQRARQHAQTMAAIKQAEAEYALSTAESGFGALAQAMSNAYGQQSRQARIAFGIQKGIALARAILAIQESIANSASIGFPMNIVTIAGAIAQGVAILANIRSASYATGGYTGPGGKYQPAGIVHAGEVVFSQEDVARHGGVHAVEAMRLGLAGYADGGIVDAPRLASPMITTPRLTAPESGHGGGNDAGTTHIHVWSLEEAANRLAELPAFQKGVVHIVGENPTTIQASWGGG